MDDRTKTAISSLDEDRTQKALGGALTSDDPNKFFSEIMKFSFAVLPLLRPGYLKEVPKQGFAEGGSVWDLLKRSASEVAEMVEPGSTTRETPSVREVATGLLPRDPYEVVGEAQKKFKEGDRLGAAEEMLGGIPETGMLRKFYHGSPFKFSEFDLAKSPEGIHLTENKEIAAEYAGKNSPNVYQVEAEYDPSRIMKSSELIENQPLFELLKDAPLDVKQPYTGERFFQALSSRLGSPEAALNYLRKSGVQGMEYPAKGHYSFYDPKLLTISKEKNRVRFKGPARPLDTPRSVEEALEYIRGLPDVPEDMKWFQSGSFGPEVSMKELGFTNAPVLAGTKKFKPDAYVNVPLEQLRVVQPSATKELVGKYIQDLPEEIPAFSYFEEGPWKGFSQMSGTHRLAAAKALGLEKLPVGVFAKAMKPSGSPFSQTKDMPVGVSREMLQDIFGKDYLGYAAGGHVLEDNYPTHYLPEVGRQVMADGGVPGQRFAAMDPSMLIGTSPQPYRGGAAYTDPGGLKVAAPFVSGLAGGYPVFNLPAPSAPEKEEAPASPAPSGPDPMVLLALMKAAKMFADGGAVESPPSIADLLREIENEEMVRKTLQSIQGTSEPSEGSTTTRGGSSPTTPQETDMEALLGRVMGTTPAGELRTPGIIESVPFDSPKQKMDPGEYISRGSTAARAHPFVFEKTPYHFGEDFARGGVTDALNAVRKLAGTPA